MTKSAAVPSHLAIIMDGNGRWAAGRGRPRWMGHVRGAHTVREVIAHCARVGIEQLTLYAFSSDNWKRPREEVGFLFDLFQSHLDRQLGALVSNGIRLSVIGRRDRLPRALVDAFVAAEERTAEGRTMHVRVAVDYSSRAAMQEAFAQADLASGDASSGDASSGDASSGDGPRHPLLPDVDLLVRTGGERRLSDFLLWECAYAELAFLDVHFPDLSSADLDAVLADYAARERRFGDVPAPTEHATADDVAAYPVHPLVR